MEIAKAAIKILKNKLYRKKLGREARLIMRRFRNYLILKKWVKLILSINNGEENYQKLRNEAKRMTEEKVKNIINNQLNLLKYKNKKFNNINLNDIINFTFMENLK